MAPTGSGKTFAYTLPILHRLKVRAAGCGAARHRSLVQGALTLCMRSSRPAGTWIQGRPAGPGGRADARARTPDLPRVQAHVWRPQVPAVRSDQSSSQRKRTDGLQVWSVTCQRTCQRNCAFWDAPRLLTSSRRVVHRCLRRADHHPDAPRPPGAGPQRRPQPVRLSPCPYLTPQSPRPRVPCRVLTATTPGSPRRAVSQH